MSEIKSESVYLTIGDSECCVQPSRDGVTLFRERSPVVALTPSDAVALAQALIQVAFIVPERS